MQQDDQNIPQQRKARHAEPTRRRGEPAPQRRQDSQSTPHARQDAQPARKARRQVPQQRSVQGTGQTASQRATRATGQIPQQKKTRAAEQTGTMRRSATGNVPRQAEAATISRSATGRVPRQTGQMPAARSGATGRMPQQTGGTQPQPRVTGANRAVHAHPSSTGQTRPVRGQQPSAANKRVRVDGQSTAQHKPLHAGGYIANNEQPPIQGEQLPQRSGRRARPPLAGTSLLARAFVVIIVVLAVVGIVLPDKETSAAENRSLQTMPKVSLSSITSGRFQDQFTDYVSDQFPARTLWADVQVAASTLAGGFESNGVYKCKSGFLVQPFEQPEDDKAAAAVEAFVAAHGDITTHALIAPTAVGVYTDLLPFGADTDDQNAYIDSLNQRFSAAGVDVIDTRSVLTSDRDDIYYHTDHHWTATGAYEAFRLAAGQLGISADTEYEEVQLTSSFAGSLKSKSGYFMVGDDTLSAYVPTSGSFNCIITYVEEQTKTTSPYEATALDGSDAYQLFMNGNHALIRVETPNLNERTLLVFKDSYANCFLPFLMDQYQKIVIVDPRYCYDSIDDIIANEGVTEALFLYNANTFASDTSLASMMGL